MNLWLLVLTGFTSAFNCVALQMGLLAGVIAFHRRSVLPTVAFLLSKLIAYIVLGYILGSLGSTLAVSETIQSFIEVIAGIFVIGTGLNLLNIHPVFRYFTLQPPRFLFQTIRKLSHSQDVLAPALLGAMMVFIPCGTTVAVEALSLSSSNPIIGAAMMGAFTIGTMPVFVGYGLLTHYLGKRFEDKFIKIEAATIIMLGLLALSQSLKELFIK